MKLITTLLLSIYGLGLMANELVDLPGKPLCSDIVVRLSPKPIPCIPDNFNPEHWDIPGLKLNLEELQKIFDGAESSGGHIIGPMNHPRRTQPITPFPFSLKCEARMLLDGKKKVSFLSTQEFELNPVQYELVLRPENWTHSLIVGADIYGNERIQVEAAPAVNVLPFKVELSYNTFYDRFQLGVCEDKTSFETTDLVCAQVENTVRTKKHTLSFQKRFSGNGKVIHQTVNVTCRLR